MKRQRAKQRPLYRYDVYRGRRRGQARLIGAAGCAVFGLLLVLIRSLGIRFSGFLLLGLAALLVLSWLLDRLAAGNHRWRLIHRGFYGCLTVGLAALLGLEVFIINRGRSDMTPLLLPCRGGVLPPDTCAVVVEAELGTLAGIEDEVNVSAEDSSYTHPEEVEEFVSKTGCDSLAIAIGTSHGAYKFKPGTKPQLRFDVLEEVSRRLPGFPIVLHGSSSVPQDLVAKVNQYGGNMPGAIGVPEDQLRKAASLAVCKINIDSDLRLAMTASIREHFALHPADFDPRQYLKPARQAIKELVAHKIVDVLGCDGKAF